MVLPNREADRITKYWEKRGGVSLEQIDAAANRGQTARVLIYNNEVRGLVNATKHDLPQALVDCSSCFGTPCRCTSSASSGRDILVRAQHWLS